ncbi:hypothetical protein ACFQ9X_10790 [Catenulispora yoronensis]
MTTVVSAGSATAAVADTGTPTASPTSPPTPTAAPASAPASSPTSDPTSSPSPGPTSPVTAPWTDPIAPITPITPVSPIAPITPVAPISPVTPVTPAPPTGGKPAPAPGPVPAPPSHPKAGAGKFDNALIATTALTYVGRWGGQACLDAHQDATGQCREFVNCVVYLATGGKIWPVDGGGNYQASFANAGAVPVAAGDATVGDIIQIGDYDSSSPLHTAIVLVNKGNGAFTVVDSNWVGQPATPELVGVHDWTPPAAAKFWRLGAVTEGSAARVAAGLKNASTGPAKAPTGGTGSSLSAAPPRRS